MVAAHYRGLTPALASLMDRLLLEPAARTARV